MRLSVLSDGYVSDSMNDAGPALPEHAGRAAGAIHFAALCRGVVVLVALAVPVGLTVLTRPDPAPIPTSGDAGPIAIRALHLQSQG